MSTRSAPASRSGWCEPPRDRLGVEKEVRRRGDRDQRDHGEQRDRLVVDVAVPQPERAEGEARLERDAAPIPHRPEQGDDDHRLHEQDERGEHERHGELVERLPGLQPRAPGR